jgi:hypothetical protein
MKTDNSDSKSEQERVQGRYAIEDLQIFHRDMFKLVDVELSNGHTY